MVRESKSSIINPWELINKAVRKAQMSSHTVNNLIAAGNLAKKWAAALGAVKTAMNKQSNANYEKAKDKHREAKQNYKAAERWPSTYQEYSLAKSKLKSAEKNLKSLEKHRK